MRQAASLKSRRGAAIAAVAQYPAPVGGLNTRDPPALVPINEAVYMQNFFPTAAGLLVRKGWEAHRTSMPASTESLMVYTSNTGAETMFAASGTEFYDVTASGAVGAAVVSGLANAQWQYTNFTNSGGSSYLCCFNGADSPRYWDGATWTAITGISTPAITGLTTTTIISAAVHQRRMWLVQTNSLKAWYLPIDSVGGLAKNIDLGGIATKGGYIMAADVWTVEGGDGLNDILLFTTSQGQLVAFAGTDPSSASTWTHVGTWDTALPLGRRCMFQHKGDVLIITRAGVASSARIMAGDAGSSAMLTDKIVGTFRSEVSSAGSTFGWQVLYYPTQDMLLLSVPTRNVYAMNTVTGAWSGAFLNHNPICWAVMGGVLYFGVSTTATGVRKFWAQTRDNASTTITGIVASGYGDFGLPGIIKKALLGRAIVTIPVSGSFSMTTQFDYNYPNFTSGALGASLSSEYIGITPWVPMIDNIGVAASVYFSVASSTSLPGDLTYSGAFITYETGGLVGAP